MVNKILDKENQSKEEKAVSDIENNNNSEGFDMLRFSTKKFAKTSGNISECSQAAEGPADIKYDSSRICEQDPMSIKNMLLKAQKVSSKVIANQFREIIKGNGLIVE